MNYFELGQYAADKTPLSFIDSGLNLFVPHLILDNGDVRGRQYCENGDIHEITLGGSYCVIAMRPASESDLSRFPSYKGSLEQPTAESDPLKGSTEEPRCAICDCIPAKCFITGNPTGRWYCDGCYDELNPKEELDENSVVKLKAILMHLRKHSLPMAMSTETHKEHWLAAYKIVNGLPASPLEPLHEIPTDMIDIMNEDNQMYLGIKSLFSPYMEPELADLKANEVMRIVGKPFTNMSADDPCPYCGKQKGENGECDCSRSRLLPSNPEKP